MAQSNQAIKRERRGLIGDERPAADANRDHGIYRTIEDAERALSEAPVGTRWDWLPA